MQFYTAEKNKNTSALETMRIPFALKILKQILYDDSCFEPFVLSHAVILIHTQHRMPCFIIENEQINVKRTK